MRVVQIKYHPTPLHEETGGEQANGADSPGPWTGQGSALSPSRLLRRLLLALHIDVGEGPSTNM